MEVLLHLSALALSLFLPHWLLLWDERRMSAAERRRAWNHASHWSAIVGFPFLCVIVHFTRTRRSLLGFGLGVLHALLLMLILGLLSMSLEWLLGVLASR